MFIMNTFQFLSNEVRVFFLGEQYWFMAADVCRCLCIQNTRDALGALDDDEKILYSDYLTCTNTDLMSVESTSARPPPL